MTAPRRQMNTCSQLTVKQEEDKGKTAHSWHAVSYQQFKMELWRLWKHSATVNNSTTQKALLFDTPLSFHCIWSSPPCLGHKCTLSCGTIVVLCPAVLSGTASSIVGYDTYEGSLMSFQQCVLCFLLYTSYKKQFHLLLSNMNQTLLKITFVFTLGFKTYPIKENNDKYEVWTSMKPPLGLNRFYTSNSQESW